LEDDKTSTPIHKSRSLSSTWNIAIVAVLPVRGNRIHQWLIGRRWDESLGLTSSRKNASWEHLQPCLFAPIRNYLYCPDGGLLFGFVWKNEAPVTNKRSASSASIQDFFLNYFGGASFFNFQYPFFALIEILLMWLAILLTIFRFAKFSKTAAWLLVPYLLWVSLPAC